MPKPSKGFGSLILRRSLSWLVCLGCSQRGLANLQLGKIAEARADLQKVVELAPDSPQAATAKKGLEQLK